MIRPIMRNELFLAMPSEAATIEDAPVGQDLLDTLQAHAHECVGMAANMIGVRKRIIVFDDNGTAKLMFNPEIVHTSSEYSTEEGCLSLVGQRPCQRYRKFACRIRMNRSKPARTASATSLRRSSSMK